MIEIKNLNKSFGSKQVLEDLNLTVCDGQVLGLVGINGAGKSTLLRLITGIYEPDSGVVLFDGENVNDNEKVKADFFFLPDEPYYGGNTTPTSLVEFYKHFYKFDKNEYFERLNRFDIPLNKSLKKFSKGMKRQVFISLGLSAKPKYLFLDEAFDGLDPLARLSLKKDLAKLLEEQNTTVIISSHSLRELEDICDTFALLDNKKISIGGAIDEELSKYHKYQMAFNNEVTKDSFNFEYKSIEIEGRLAKVITKLTMDELKEKVDSLNPLIIDEISIDFEELFIIEVENRGYVK